MRRIAHLTATFPPYRGGAGNAAYHLSAEQARRGDHVEVFTAPADGPTPPTGAIVHRPRPAFAIGNAPLLPEIGRLSGFDVVHLHYPFIFGTELALAGSPRRRSALVVGYKNQLVAGGAKGAAFAVYEHSWGRAMARLADRILILSPEHADSVPYLASARRRTPERLVSFPNGVDLKAFSPRDHGDPVRARTRARLGIPSEAVVAVFVATFDRAHAFKRLDIAVEALAALGRDDVHLVVVGDGELLADHATLARRRGVSDRLHLAGSADREQLPELLCAGDVVMLTSEPPESFGIVLIEGMACGLPALVSDYPGARAVVDDEQTGFVVPMGDVEATAAALGRYAEMGEEGRRAMGATARARCEERYAWGRLVDRLDGIYAEAIAASARRTGRGAGARRPARGNERREDSS